MKTKFWILILALIVSLTSCNNDDDNNNTNNNSFSEISDIATFHGNLNSNTVIVNTQGGPVTSLLDDTVQEWMSDSNTQNVLWVNVHQAQTKNPSAFTGSNITFEEAKAFDTQSVNDLKRVVEYFKQQPNKTVYVLGVSFGAFMTQELIAENDIDIADGYLIVVGRLDIDDATWMPFSEGKMTEYLYDANGDYTIQVMDAPNTEQANMNRLAAGLGFNRYTNKLSSMDDLSKITYIFGNRDEQVGPLSSNEIQFLSNKGATVTLVNNGDHDAAIGHSISTLKQTFNIN